MQNEIIYVDERGWRYTVMPGIGGDCWKGHYWTPERCTWHCMKVLPWNRTVEGAQADLDAYARKKQWQKMQD